MPPRRYRSSNFPPENLNPGESSHYVGQDDTPSHFPRSQFVPPPSGFDPWGMFQSFFERQSAYPPPPVDFLDRASRHRPPTYSGDDDGDYTVLDEWRYRMSGILDAIGCPADQQVTVASSYLTGRALQWWRTFRADPTAPTDLDWTEFIRQMGDEFYPPRFRQHKKEEFRALVQQDGMSVTEYYHQYIDLMRHGMDLVPTDADKIKKFEEGLHPTVRQRSFRNTLREAYNHALLSEQTEKERQDYYTRMGQGQSDPDPRHWLTGQRGANDGLDENVTTGNAAVQCFVCQEWGHTRQRCPIRIAGSSSGTGQAEARMANQCQYCWRRGHRREECSRYLSDFQRFGTDGESGAVRQCRYCWRLGHRQKDCFNFIKDRQNHGYNGPKQQE